MSKHLPVLATDNTEFSYTCHACRRCCYDKRIQLNPYELARLARNRGISTTELIAEFTKGGTALKSQPNGACVFLGEEGCTVHADRPLVCRLYPLGRIVQMDGRVNYVEFEAHPQTKGSYGTDGTIAEFVESQGVAPYIAASDRYYTVLINLGRALNELADASTFAEGSDATNGETPNTDFIDVHAAVGAECRRTGEQFHAVVGLHRQRSARDDGFVDSIDGAPSLTAQERSDCGLRCERRCYRQGCRKPEELCI